MKQCYYLNFNAHFNIEMLHENDSSSNQACAIEKGRLCNTFNQSFTWHNIEQIYEFDQFDIKTKCYDIDIRGLF